MILLICSFSDAAYVVRRRNQTSFQQQFTRHTNNLQDAVMAIRARGKPEHATLRIGATQDGKRVITTVSDDDGGIDRDAVRRVAMQRGLISRAAEPSDAAIDNLILPPWFSTAFCRG